jgi:hypothetical protein
MYGKFFASTFTGSMFGAGPDVFALWGYVIANAHEGQIEIHPRFVASVIGTTPERLTAALDYLCAPDAHSRSGAEDGRRLCHEGGYQYRVVNHAHYRAIRNEDDRRAYNREAKRRERARKAAESHAASMTFNESQHIQKQSTEAEADQTHKERVSGSTAPLVDQRTHRGHALCGQVCLPGFLHAEFRRLKGGDETAARAYVDAWWLRLDTSLAAGHPPIGDALAFLRGRWAADHPTPTPDRTEARKAAVLEEFLRRTS